MIFVTGGTGLVGSHLLLDLAREGKQITALKRPTSNVDAVNRLFEYYEPGANLQQQITWVDGNLLDVPLLEKQMAGATEVYHCAALVSFSPKDRQKLLDQNITGTANMVNMALEHSVRKFCHVSSTAAIGGKPQPKPIQETLKWQSDEIHSDYALSKHYSEREVWRGAEEGLNMVIVNPCVVVGPGAWGKSSTSMISQVWKGLKFYTAGGNAFVDARDVSRAMRQLMASDIHSERFLVVSENMLYRDFFNAVADALSKSRPSFFARPALMEIIWRIERVLQILTTRRPLITKATAESSGSKKFFSSEKLKAALDFEFIPVADSIQDTCRIFLEDVKKGVV